MIANHSRVRLLTDRFRSEGIGMGAIGYVIEVYDGKAYEVEFSDPYGIAIAQIVALSSQAEFARRNSLVKTMNQLCAST